jgi:Tat protein secretion system quality control protein TatD with DNase activity
MAHVAHGSVRLAILLGKKQTFIKHLMKIVSEYFRRCVVGKHPTKVEEKGKNALEVEEKAPQKAEKGAEEESRRTLIPHPLFC